MHAEFVSQLILVAQAKRASDIVIEARVAARAPGCARPAGVAKLVRLVATCRSSARAIAERAAGEPSEARRGLLLRLRQAVAACGDHAQKVAIDECSGVDPAWHTDELCDHGERVRQARQAYHLACRESTSTC